jgi:hypothetical protein
VRLILITDFLNMTEHPYENTVCGEISRQIFIEMGYTNFELNFLEYMQSIGQRKESGVGLPRKVQADDGEYVNHSLSVLTYLHVRCIIHCLTQPSICVKL